MYSFETPTAVSSHQIFKFSEDSPRFSEGHTNVSEHFRIFFVLPKISEKYPFICIGNFVKISSSLGPLLHLGTFITFETQTLLQFLLIFFIRTEKIPRIGRSYSECRKPVLKVAKQLVNSLK